MPTSFILTAAGIISYRVFLISQLLTHWPVGAIVMMFLFDHAAFAVMGARSIRRWRTDYQRGLVPKRPPSAIAYAWLIMTFAGLLTVSEGGFGLLIPTTVSTDSEFNLLVGVAAFGTRFGLEWLAEGKIPQPQRRWADSRLVTHSLLRILPAYLGWLYVFCLAFTNAADGHNAFDALYQWSWLLPCVTVAAIALGELIAAFRRQVGPRQAVS